MMQSYSRRGFLVLGAGTVLSACSLPRGAAQRSEILAGAGGEMPEFTVHAVTRDFLAEMRHWPDPHRPAHHGWIPGSGGGAATRLAPGDRLDLRIWDPEATSLITAPGQKMTDMEGLVVSPGGNIFVPYVGEIGVGGLTPEDARRTIQGRMESIVPSAQVQLVRAAGRRNSVDLVSGAAQPGRYPLEDLETTVLNLLSQAGGVPAGLRNPRVRLVRGGRTYMTPLSALYSDPARDTALRGGDKLIVEEDDRFFIALGAAGREEVIDFPSEEVSALKAVSLMGGVLDTRADPEGVLVLRSYPAAAVGPDGPGSARVVFSLDLTTADGVFSATEFAIRPGDVVLATESPTTSAQTVFALLGSAFGLAGRASNV